ncbi:hypothetical protein DL771_002433 [Monosporascus sp. 5C6A]|nr:hypothetical protein DL771_002433 [Monosporascus sp. 5C6A]
MVTTTSSAAPAQHHGDDTPYYFVPDADEQAAKVQGYGWMQPIIIDDDDLMFGGKSLSAWYEEERQSLSISAEEERRGRQRGGVLSCGILIPGREAQDYSVLRRVDAPNRRMASCRAGIASLSLCSRILGPGRRFGARRGAPARRRSANNNGLDLRARPPVPWCGNCCAAVGEVGGEGTSHYGPDVVPGAVRGGELRQVTVSRDVSSGTQRVRRLIMPTVPTVGAQQVGGHYVRG